MSAVASTLVASLPPIAADENEGTLLLLPPPLPKPNVLFTLLLTLLVDGVPATSGRVGDARSPSLPPPLPPPAPLKLLAWMVLLAGTCCGVGSVICRSPPAAAVASNAAKAAVAAGVRVF